MPLYQFDDGLHVTERRESLETASIICRCGRNAKRVPFYIDQYINCDTGPKGGLKNEPPRDEKNYRHKFKEFQEASQEMDHFYSKNDDPTVKAPNHYKEGVKRARKVASGKH